MRTVQMDYSSAKKQIEEIGKSSVYANGEANTKRVMIETVLHKLLGYTDIADIEMEYTADVGTKAGEKVDYAIRVNGVVRILVEAKASTEVLDTEYLSQLYRYYAVTDAEIGILTNGTEWQIYTDIQKPNIMDLKPVYIVNLRKYTETDNEVFEYISKHKYSKDTLIEVCKRKERAERRKQNDRLKEYNISKRLDIFLHSEAFCKYIKDDWQLDEYSIDEVKMLVAEVLNGSYVLKYADEAQYVHSNANGKPRYNLLTLDSKAETVNKYSFTEVRYINTGNTVVLNDIHELPYAIITLIGKIMPIRQFDEELYKQTQKKSWITLYTGEEQVLIGMSRVNDYLIANARTAKEAVTRSIQIIRALRLNPISFMLEEK